MGILKHRFSGPASDPNDAPEIPPIIVAICFFHLPTYISYAVISVSKSFTMSRIVVTPNAELAKSINNASIFVYLPPISITSNRTNPSASSIATLNVPNLSINPVKFAIIPTNVVNPVSIAVFPMPEIAAHICVEIIDVTVPLNAKGNDIDVTTIFYQFILFFQISKII